MNSIEDLRDYVIADVIHQVESMSREELVQTLVLICTTPLEKMDANELLEFRKTYAQLWPLKSHVQTGTG
ncbi:MAG: hypothetical protein WBK28_00295 [Minisyncoccia bacterium]